ncbi:AAA family ATPase [Alkalicella caledoniensis]|uniref:AAA family ATPase n=1 Tax=Alkalicella caledoniensis TaxID=2731377 RepID=A0A7G9W6N1_ALKCA|nr:EutP/PduV family microcompartment system protein [Alkalicella caledoniensis]QNO14343.1 AAA family ATPase [Alkalicella caledoniensis]
MKKILVIGIVASGKTTLAKRLSKTLGIPWFELDCIVYHQTENERYKRTQEEQIAVINNIDSGGSWIFEGTDRESYRCLFDMADTIIFLDTPLWKRKSRIFIRFLKQKFGFEKSHYKSDIKMLKMMYKWTIDFERNRVSFEEKLKLYNKKLIRLADNKNLKPFQPDSYSKSGNIR